MPIRDLLFRIRARNETDEGLAEVEQGAQETGDRLGTIMSAAIAGAVASGIADALAGVDEYINAREERVNALELRVFTPTSAEEDLQRSITGGGFSNEEAAAGVLATRAFDLDAGSQQANNLGQTAAALNRAGVNTRFLPQVAQRFGISDSDELVAQLGVGADVVSQAGIDFEEVYSEIADNPQVYGAFPTFAHAAQFISQTGLAPSETTIQLEQGFLQPTGGEVTGDPYTLTGITPSAQDRIAQSDSAQAVLGALEAIPGIGGSLAGGARGLAGTILSAQGSPLDRTGGADLTFSGQPGPVLVDGQPVGFADALSGLRNAQEATIGYQQANQDLGAGGGSRASVLEAQIESLLALIARREQQNQNLPAGITYDPERAAAADRADLRRIGVLTGELRELTGG